MIIVDDYIPVLEISQAVYQPIFTDIQSKRNIGNGIQSKSIKFRRTDNTYHNVSRKVPSSEPVEIWMYLIEKALAKVYSSYESLMNGNFFDLLTELTGYDMEKWDFR